MGLLNIISYVQWEAGQLVRGFREAEAAQSPVNGRLGEMEREQSGAKQLQSRKVR